MLLALVARELIPSGGYLPSGTGSGVRMSALGRWTLFAATDSDFGQGRCFPSWIVGTFRRSSFEWCLWFRQLRRHPRYTFWMEEPLRFTAR